MTTAPSALPSCTLVAPGSNDGCANQHCYCPSGGGVVVPPLTSVISGTTTTDCSYTTQPSIDSCPPAPLTSTTSSTTLTTSTTAAASPTVGPITCNTYETSYSHCWTDIDAKTVNTTADAMIGTQLPNGPMTSGTPNSTEVVTVKGLNYFINIGWIPGCVAVDSQNPANPIASDQSIATRDILWQTYNDCPDNHGIGGYSDTVCLRIGFFPTKVEKVGGNPPAVTNYWNDPVYC
ncbi:hypothetical protein HO173_004155 [Letharia columbiana]|uniref:Uncharacterized protein n=1 Tax=Letharia columbiana TaxID=112416 RepID=A0A8H6L753_9LECA|nr:uncharacterized protein HO173_004155 [Letharia columbiana]KAF6237954.1 hypothetical protein HO173_004155 [Letharia columbiana]